jgi:hypothetical protein
LELTVYPLRKDEVYLDIVRIPEEHRRTPSGLPIEEGKVCRLLCRGEEVYVIARGSEHSDNSICVDEKIRRKLRIECGKPYNFDMTVANFCGQIKWALEASDVRFSLPARITLVSGCFGIVLGILSVMLGLRGC